MNSLNLLVFQVDAIALLPEVFLALSFLIVLIYGSFLVRQVTQLYTYLSPSVARLTLIILGLSFILVYNNPVVNEVIWNATFIVDSSSTLIKLILIGGMFLCLLVTEEYLFLAKIRPYEIFVFLIGIVLSVSLLVSSYDLLSVYLNIEFLSLIFYTLAAWKRDSGFSAEAGLKYFILGSLASVFFLFGSSLVYLVMGTTNFGSLALLFDKLSTFSALGNIGLLCIGSALLFKLGSAPYHMWVVDVYEGSPTIITLIFASIPKLAILVVLSRLALGGSWSSFPHLWETLFCTCGILSLFIGCFGGLGEIKLKRVLAYSGIGHVGFLCLSLSCGSLEGAQATFFYIFVYMLTAIYTWTYVLHLSPIKKNVISLVDSVGLVQANPVLGLLTSLMFFSLAGIPPLGGFFAKLFVFLALIDSSFYLIALLSVLTSAISAFYYLRLVKILYFEKPKTWIFFDPISKSQAFTLLITSVTVILFMLQPNLLYLLSYKLGLSFLI